MVAPVRYRVWVGGLPREVAEDDLYEKFSKYGPIQDVTIRHSDCDTYSFITYTERADAEEAIARMDRSSIWGTPVKVNISKDFPPNGPRNRGVDGRPVNSAPRRAPNLLPWPPRPQSRRDQDRCDSRSPDHELPHLSPRRSRSPTHPSGARRRGRRRTLRRRYSPSSASSSQPRRSCALRDDSCGLRSPEPGLAWRGRVQGASALPALKDAPKVTPKVGEYRITIENIPDDMSWLELKDLGKEYGDSVTFSRTYRRGSIFFGMLEFSEQADAARTISELNGRRIQGGTSPMRVYDGDSWNA